MKTNVGQKFLRIIDKCIPKGSLLYPLINRSKVKISYSYMPNMGQKINDHNEKSFQIRIKFLIATAETRQIALSLESVKLTK